MKPVHLINNSKIKIFALNNNKCQIDKCVAHTMIVKNNNNDDEANFDIFRVLFNAELLNMFV